jgi:CheY-like chemotaxis protein
MPKFTAFNALRSSAETASISVIAMTGSVMQQDVDRITTSRFLSIIHKPLRINEVL